MTLAAGATKPKSLKKDESSSRHFIADQPPEISGAT